MRFVYVTCGLLVLVLVVVGLALLMPCSQVGCLSGFLWRLDSPLAGEALTGMQIEACSPLGCLRGPLLSESTLQTDEASLTQLGEDARQEASVVVHRRRASQATLDVRWMMRERGTTKDGDRYRITLRDVRGNVLFESHETVRYERRYPNGRLCDWDSECLQALADRRSQRDR